MYTFYFIFSTFKTEQIWVNENVVRLQVDSIQTNIWTSRLKYVMDVNNVKFKVI